MGKLTITFIVILAIAGLVLSVRQTAKSKLLNDDLNKNGLTENYLLENGQLTVSENFIQLWQSPKAWYVDDFVLADSTNDGIVDLNLSVWKKGNFGSSKPFWIKKNDQGIKNHFFIFNLRSGKIKAVWQSSNLSAPNCAFRVLDLDKDGKNELSVLEGEYQKIRPLIARRCLPKYSAIWQWNGWGFTNISRATDWQIAIP